MSSPTSPKGIRFGGAPLPTNDFLHRNPALYEHVFDVSAAEVCLEIFHKHLVGLPRTVLDMGCGTGRDLNQLATHGVVCTGVDFVPTMIEYAKSAYPGIHFLVGDMRDLRLNKRFDVIMTLGSGLNYMLTNSDLNRAIETFRVLSADGALLIIEPLHTASFVGSNTPPTTFHVSTEEFTAHGKAEYIWHPTTQILERRRIWRFTNGKPSLADSFKLRLLFVRELEHFLDMAGFEVLEVFERKRSKIYDKSLYIVARFTGSR